MSEIMIECPNCQGDLQGELGDRDAQLAQLRDSLSIAWKRIAELEIANGALEAFKTFARGYITQLEIMIGDLKYGDAGRT